MKSKIVRFSSEALLQQAVAGLFQRMPNVGNVQILQGPSERGKDIVFTSDGPLGERMSCACVVKNNTITGNVEKNSGARTVLFQAQQCLDSPYIDAAGECIRVERVYVITPYPIGKQVMGSIVGALAHQSRQVVFYDGIKLFDLIQRWWPDFFADEASAIERYLSLASRELSVAPEINYLDNLYDFDPPNDRRVYVPLGFCREFFLYNFDTSLVSHVPTDVDFTDRRWSRTGDRDLEAAYEATLRFVQHLQEWGFWKGASSTSSLQEFLPPATEIINLFPEAWKKTAMDISPRSKITGILPKLDPLARLFLSDPEEFCIRVEQIANILCSQSIYTRDVFSHYRQAVESLRDNVSQSPLANFPFRGQSFLAKFDVCLRYSPRGIARSTDSVAIAFGSDLHEKINGSLLVVGPAGSGKTSFCRWSALKDAAKHAEDSSRPVPVYVPLHRIARESISNLRELLLWTVGSTALLNERDREQVIDSCKSVRVYLDGFDEIRRDQDKQHVMALIRDGVEGNPRFQAIVTARDYIASPWLDWLPRVRIGELSSDDLFVVAREWLSSDRQASDFMNQLAALPSLREILRNPLLATLTILVFRQTGTLPDSRTRLYRIFVELLCGGWDLAKGILRKSLFSREAKSRILTELAVLAHQRGQKVFDSGLLAEAARLVFGGNFSVDIAILEAELRSDAIICFEGSNLRFIHLSFQEYFCATFILGQSHTGELKRVVKYFDSGDDWWREVIRFYIGLTRDPRGFLRWLKRLSQKNQRLKELEDMVEEEVRSLKLTLKARSLQIAGD